MEAHPRKRIVLVPRDADALPGRPAVKRYALARLGPSSRSALGRDRLERLEEVAALDRDGRAEPPS